MNALAELLEAWTALGGSEPGHDPFELSSPRHMGLPEEAFMSEDELAHLRKAIREAARDNERLAEMYGLGAMVVARAKGLLL